MAKLMKDMARPYAGLFAIALVIALLGRIGLWVMDMTGAIAYDYISASGVALLDVVCSILTGSAFVAFIFAGSLLSNDLVWELADMFNQLMVLPNAIALFALTGSILAIANAKHDKKATDVHAEHAEEKAWAEAERAAEGALRAEEDGATREILEERGDYMGREEDDGKSK